MGVGDEKLNPRLAQVAVVARIEGAFGQPGAARRPPEMLDVILPRDLNLGALDLLVGHQRQIAMRRVTCDDLQEAFILKLAEPTYDIPAILVFKNISTFTVMSSVYQRARMKLGG